MTSLLEILSYRGQYQSDKKAYIFLEDGETESESFTYGELDKRARAIASYLCHKQGERALLLYPSGLEFIVAFFGCMYAGVVAVPVYPPRRNQKLSRLISIVNNAQATVALTTTSILSDIEKKWLEVPELAQLKLVATDSIEANNQDFVPHSVSPDSLAFLQYTSGSTGNPKGVMVTHENIIHNQQTIQTAFCHNEKSIMVGWLPLFHDMGLIGNVLQPIYVGFPSILMSPSSFLQKPIRWLEAISKYRATTSGGPNFGYDLCIKKIQPEELTNLDLSSWDLAYNGAEPIRAETLKQFGNKFAAYGFNYKAFYPCYGMAETTLFATGGHKNNLPVLCGLKAKDLEANLAVETEISSPESRVFVSVGHSYTDTTVIIVNPELLTCCEKGKIGEIWIKSPSVASGYWKLPQVTEKTFQAYLKDTGDGPFLRTGDLGFFRNEELFITGRIKDVIIIRGRNYYPQDIELTVENSHASLVPNCSAAFSVEIEAEEGLIIACEVQRTHLRNLKSSEVIKKIQSVVFAENQLEVAGVVLLKPGSIPKTSSGKIQRRACKQKYLENSLNVVEQWQRNFENNKQKYVAPSTSSEEIIAKIFAEVLGVENIGIDDNFFDNAVPSLQALQIISRLEEAFNVELSLGVLLDYPTIKKLDRAIIELIQNQAEIVAPIEEKLVSKTKVASNRESWWGKDNEYPLSPEFEMLWIASKMIAADTFSPKFLSQKRSNWNCQFDPVLLERACNLLVERNEILRTRLISKSSKLLKILDTLFPSSLIEEKSNSSSNYLEQVFLGFLHKPNSFAAKLIHRLLSFKINLELSLVRQKILPSQPVEFTYYDYKSIADKNALIANTEQIATKEIERPLDMEKGPLFRCAAIANPNNTLTAIVTVHHRFVDYTSLEKVTQELYTIYQALITNNYDSLELRPQYRHYATSWAAFKNSPSGKANISYWKKHLASCNPIVIPPKPSAEYLGEFNINEPIDKEIGIQINSYCQENPMLVSAFFLAAYYLLLHQVTKEKKLIALVTNGSRLDSFSEETIGYFLQIFPLVLDLQKIQTIDQLIQASTRNTLALLEHRRVSLPRLVSDDMGIAAVMTKQPLCLFQTVETTIIPKENPGVPYSNKSADTEGCRFDILMHSSGNYTLRVNYNTAFYGHEYIKSLTNKYQEILNYMVENLQGDINALTKLNQLKKINSEVKNQSIQFSLLYFSSNEAEFTDDKYQLFIEGAKFADKHNFKAVWIPERHFHSFGGIYPNPSVLGAALAMVTENIRIRAGSVVLPLHNPIRVAEEWSVVDNLSSGRVDIAFAMGWNPNDFVLSRDNYINRKEVLFSEIKTVQQLWEGKSISVPNGVGEETKIKIYPLPKQQELNVWITCSGGKERFAEAGSCGGNILTALLFQSVEELAEKISIYREARAKNGYAPETGNVTLMLHTFIGEDIDIVREQVKHSFLEYLKSSVNLWKQNSQNLDELNSEERENLLSFAFERYFQSSALFGTPNSCLKMVKRLQEIGVNEIACLIDFGVDKFSVMDSLKHLNSLRELANFKSDSGDLLKSFKS